MMHPIDRALVALRGRAFRSPWAVSGFILDGQQRTAADVIAAANWVMVQEERPLIRYPGVDLRQHVEAIRRRRLLKALKEMAQNGQQISCLGKTGKKGREIERGNSGGSDGDAGKSSGGNKKRRK